MPQLILALDLSNEAERVLFLSNKVKGILLEWNSLRISAEVSNFSVKNKSNVVHHGLCFPRW